MEKLIVTCALTGAETTKEMNANLPVTPEEQIQAAEECWSEGCSVVHLHVRDENGRPSQRADLFERVLRGIRARTDLIVQFSTGGAVGTPVEERLKPLDLQPDMASLNVGSLNFGDEVFENLPRDVEKLAARMKKLGIKPEVEVYDLGMLEYGTHLVEKNVIPAPAHFQFVMGTRHGISGAPENLFTMRSKLPAGSTFAVAGVGRAQLQLAPLSIVSGGHVRVGFEDNLLWARGVPAQSNAQLVKRTVELAKILQRDVATPGEARKILGIG
ncbi:MAG: 3-keto-5-aminohexanoate cleavage protein [Bdellovibrionales bacterium]|nr:3-keto-5-aminohexanoate cleavage protein [Bdellovibrionales bacterium]